MNDKSILVIGNGESILNQRLQKKIDSFDKVLRINNYIIKDFELFVGTKTDIWFNGANSKLVSPKIMPKQVIVSPPSEIIIKHQKNLKDYIARRVGQDYNNLTLLTLEEVKRYEKEVCSNRLTTGLYAIKWALNNFEKVYIHGFDFFINSKAHYYDSKLMNFVNNKILNKGHKHNNELEKKYVKRLIKNDKIKRYAVRGKVEGLKVAPGVEVERVRH